MSISVVASLNGLEIVTASRGLKVNRKSLILLRQISQSGAKDIIYPSPTSACKRPVFRVVGPYNDSPSQDFAAAYRNGKQKTAANKVPGIIDWDTHFAGHPNEKLTFEIRVAWSNISNSCAPSTAGSHSLRNSGVTRTDFHAASEIGSSPTGTSRTARYMVWPDLLGRRWMMTSVSSGMFDARALPLVGEPASFATGTRFHSDDECEVRSWRKCAWALSRASYHDWRSLEEDVIST